MDYWKECIEEAFCDAGLTATEDQISIVKNHVKSAHDMHHFYSGEEHIPNPVNLENENLKKHLEREKNKVICGNCKGKGYVTLNSASHSSTSDCHICKGNGFVYR